MGDTAKYKTFFENKHRLRNTIIVAGVGAGVGAGIGAALHKPCSSKSFCLDVGGAALPAAVGAVLGGVGGAVVGVLCPPTARFTM